MVKRMILVMTLAFLMSFGITAAWADEVPVDPTAGDDVVVGIVPEELPAADEALDGLDLDKELGVSEDELGLEPLSEPEVPDAEERERLQTRLQGQLGTQLNGLRWDGQSLLATSRRLALVARARVDYFNSNPDAKREFMRLCDQVVRLNSHEVRNEEIKQRVFRNMAAAYAYLGCYHRAIACLERGLAVGARNEDLMRDLKYLYSKVGHGALKVFVNGQHPQFDVRPTNMNGRTMVPIRALAEALGQNVAYNNGQINFNRGGRQVNLYVNNTTAYVGNKKVQMDQPAVAVNGRTLVPLRFVTENLNCRVDYDSESGVIMVEDDAVKAVA